MEEPTTPEQKPDAVAPGNTQPPVPQAPTPLVSADAIIVIPEPAPLQSEPPIVQSTPPTPTPAVSVVPNITSTLAPKPPTHQGATPLSTPPPNPTPSPLPDTEMAVEFDEEKGQQGSVDTSSIQRIRTFKSDIADAMNKQNASLVSIAAAEQERRGGAATIPVKELLEEVPSSFSIKKLLIGIIGGILLLGGLGVIGYIFFFYKSAEVVVDPDIPSLIFADSKQAIDTSSKDARSILQALTIAKDSTARSLGDIEQLYLNARTVDGAPTVLTSQDFLSIINARVSDSFLRSLGSTFTVGVHVFNGNQPFILFTTNSYENSFAGMLAWEETIQGTLAPLFGEALPTAFQNISSTSTSTKGGTLPIARTFQDRVIRNIDARVLTDDSGAVVLLYAFPSQQVLVLTTNEQTLVEVISRLNNTRVF